MPANITPSNTDNWIKLWAKMHTFLHVLTTAHPVTKEFIGDIDNNIKQKYLTAEEKYKTVFDALVSTSNEDIRKAISLTTQTLQKQPKQNKIAASRMILSGFDAHKKGMGKLPNAINGKIPVNKINKAPSLS